MHTTEEQGMALLWFAAAIALVAALLMGVPHRHRGPVSALGILFWGLRREGFPSRLLVATAALAALSATAAVSGLGAAIVANALLWLWAADRRRRTNGSERPEVLLRSIGSARRAARDPHVVEAAWDQLPQELRANVEATFTRPIFDWLEQASASTAEEIDDALDNAPPEVIEEAEAAVAQAREILVAAAADRSIRTTFAHPMRRKELARLAVRTEHRVVVGAAVVLLDGWAALSNLIITRVVYGEVKP
jgi:hypothetical protein